MRSAAERGKKPRWSWQSKTEGVTEIDVVMLSKRTLLFHERSPLMDLLICRAQGSRRQSELKFHAIHQTAISWHGVVGHIMVQSYIKNSHSHLLLQWELHMAAITSIKDPLVNLNTNAHRQTHVDLQQPFEDIQNLNRLFQLLWSTSNIAADKKRVEDNAFVDFFCCCFIFTIHVNTLQRLQPQSPGKQGMQD